MICKKSLKKYFSYFKIGCGFGMLRNMLCFYYLYRLSIINLDDVVLQMGFFDININFI